MNALTAQYNVFLTLLTKDQLKALDNAVFCGDVHDYYGYNWTKSDMLSHISVSEDEKLRDVVRYTLRTVAVLTELYSELRNKEAQNYMLYLEREVKKYI